MSNLLRFWTRLNSRERWAVGVCAAFLVATAVWLLLLQRPLALLRQAPALHAQADAQLAAMRGLAARAQSLQQSNNTTRNDPVKALDTALSTHLGAGNSLNVLGTTANVNIKGAGAPNVLAFIAAARSEAKALPTAVNLQQRMLNGSLVWDGSISLTLAPSP
jgi:general secretion pathway protein M